MYEIWILNDYNESVLHHETNSLREARNILVLKLSFGYKVELKINLKKDLDKSMEVL